MTPSITTRSYNRARTGATDNETVLTATAVRSKGIIKLFSVQVDDQRIDAQPLAVGGLTMSDGHTHNVIFQATNNNSIFAFDADDGGQLWKRNLGTPIRSVKSNDMHHTNDNFGIMSTPVIDEGAGILYACAWISPDGTTGSGHHFLAALHLKDGTNAKPLLTFDGAFYKPQGLPKQNFSSAERKQRAALMIFHDHVFIPFGTVNETGAQARGWLIAVDTKNWQIAATWCSTVTGHGGGIWHSGGGPALGSDGSIYVITGNGAFNPQNGDFSESVVKLKFQPGNAAPLTVDSWWTPYTDKARQPATHAAAAAAPRPSNLQINRVLGHAKRMKLAAIPELDTGQVDTGPHAHDAALAPIIQDIILSNGTKPDWSDQDFGSGGPVFVDSAKVILACGKDGVLYTANSAHLGDTQPNDLGTATAQANYAKLQFPPILYTFFDPSIPPAPDNPQALNRYPGAVSRHLHGTPLLWKSALHGMMHFVGGENSALRVWTIDANGASTYLAGSDEIASPQAGRPPGGMPGWSICLAANNGQDGIVVGMVPYTDSNMETSWGRMLVYDAQDFATNPDGSKRLQVIWDSQDWGPEHAFLHPKFNRPIVWNGRIYRPTNGGTVDVYGLTH
jgi:hypothetical protein